MREPCAVLSYLLLWVAWTLVGVELWNTGRAAWAIARAPPAPELRSLARAWLAAALCLLWIPAGAWLWGRREAALRSWERLQSRAAAAAPPWLQLLGLDALGFLLEARRQAGMALSAALTVEWDPCGRSAQPVALGGTCAYSHYAVRSAPSERERRVVAWFLRWHDAPTDADWAQCLARFGLNAVPAPFALRLWSGEGKAQLTVESLTLGSAAGPGSRALRLQSGGLDRRVSGPTPLGGHAVRGYIRAFAAGRRAF